MRQRVDDRRAEVLRVAHEGEAVAGGVLPGEIGVEARPHELDMGHVIVRLWDCGIVGLWDCRIVRL